MNWTETPWTKLHEKNRWCAMIMKTHELVCVHDTYKELHACMEIMGLTDKVVFSKEMLGRGMSKSLLKLLDAKQSPAG